MLEAAWGLGRIAWDVAARWVLGQWHGLHATLVEELSNHVAILDYSLGDFGRWSWAEMKRDIERSFKDDANCGGTAILRKLEERVAAGEPLEVLLLGHSAGSIYICEFLRKAEEMGIQGLTFDVVFFAPAVTFDLFTEVLAGNPGNRVRNLRVFTMKDSREQADKLLRNSIPDKAWGLDIPPVLEELGRNLYPHSLLYLISGLLEGKDQKDKALVGMQRFYAPEFGAAAHKSPAVQDGIDLLGKRVVWADTTNGQPGWNSSADSHGGFPREQLTHESTERIILSGLGAPVSTG